MQKNIYHSALRVTLAGGLCLSAACNKWLDVSPRSEIKEDRLFSTEQGFKDALYGAYSSMTTTALYGGESTIGFVSVLAQDYDVTNPLNYYSEAGKYNYGEVRNKSRISGIWNGAYFTIANINNLLGHIEAGKDLFRGDNFNLVKGEALGLRAYLHFDLLRLFAPSWASGKDKPALPYVASLSKKVTPVSTVAGVTDLALKDLQEAVALLENDPLKTGAAGGTDDLLLRRNCHFNLYAAKALMARIYLYRGDKEKALQYATEVIAAGRFPFITEKAISEPEDKRDRTFSTEHVFALYIYNLGAYVDVHLRNTDVYTIFTNTEDNIKAIFDISRGGATDYRYAYQWALHSGTKFPSKFWQIEQAPQKLKYLMPLIRISEMYYIAAECAPQTADGVRFLNTVRQNRGLGLLAETIDAAELQEYLQGEYRKEFYSEGQTFFYYKRLALQNVPGTDSRGDDKMYVLPIPEEEREYN